MKKTMFLTLMFLIAGGLFAGEILMDKVYFSWVDKLNLRDKPSLTSTVLYQFAEGEDLIYMGKKTADQVTIELRGVKYTTPWVLVKSKTGKEGWVFAGAVKKKDALEVTVDKLKLYADPDTKSMVLSELKKGAAVFYKGYQTDKNDSFQSGGKTVQDVWLMVQDGSGYKGWVPSPYVKNTIGGAPDVSQMDKGKAGTAGELVNAIEKANPGDVITVKSGTYYLTKTLVIDQKEDITITGEGEVNIYIKDENANVIEIVDSGIVNLKNLHLKHSNPPKELKCTGNVIQCGESDVLNIENCVIDGSGYWGLYLFNIATVNVKNTTFQNHVDSSLELYDIEHLFIKNCVFKKNGGGINISGISDYQIFQNTYSDKGKIMIGDNEYTREEFEQGLEFGYGD